jgi:hypothetical protein
MGNIIFQVIACLLFLVIAVIAIEAIQSTRAIAKENNRLLRELLEKHGILITDEDSEKK